MKEKRKNLAWEEISTMIDAVREQRDHELAAEAEQIARRILNKIALGKFRILDADTRMIEVRLRSWSPLGPLKSFDGWDELRRILESTGITHIEGELNSGWFEHSKWVMTIPDQVGEKGE